MRIKKYLNIDNKFKILGENIEDVNDILLFSNKVKDNTQFYCFGDLTNLQDHNAVKTLILLGEMRDGEHDSLIFQYDGNDFLISLINSIDNKQNNLIITNRGLNSIVISPFNLSLVADYIRLSNFSNENAIILKNAQRFLNEVSIKNKARKFLYIPDSESTIDFVDGVRIIRNSQSVNYTSGGLYNLLLQYKDYLVDSNYFTVNLSLKRYEETSFEYNILPRKILIKGQRQTLSPTGFNLATNYQKTFTPSDVNVNNNTITIQNHGFSNDDEVVLWSSNTLPDGIDKYKVYRVSVVDSDTIRLKFINSFIPFNDAGQGTHYIQKYKRNLTLSFTTLVPSNYLGCYVRVENTSNRQINGLYKITNIQGTNLTLEVNCFFQVFTGTSYVVFSTLSFNDENYAISIASGNKLSFENVVIENTHPTGAYCLRLVNAESDILSDIGVAGGIIGLYLTQSKINGGTITVSDSHSIACYTTNKSNLALTGLHIQNKNVGLLAENNSVYMGALTVGYGAIGAQSATTGVIQTTSGSILYCGLACSLSIRLGRLYLGNTTLDGSEFGIFNIDCSDVYMFSGTIRNQNVGILSYNASRSSFSSSTVFQNNQTNALPAFNTVDNNNSINCKLE